MRSVGVISFVLVALCSAAFPASANALKAQVAREGCNLSENSPASNVSTRHYWSSQSEYLLMAAGTSPARGQAPRKILISGWHPVEGFETEVAEEAAYRAKDATERGSVSYAAR